jgi:RNA polymerase sigma-70 factor (ECF subfamily)
MLTQEDQNRFEALLAPVLPTAYGAALHMTRNRDDAEDLLQETSVQAFRAFQQFQPGTNFKAWFFRILTNLFYQRYRRRRREPELAPLEDASELYLYVQTARAGLHGAASDPVELVLGRMDEDAIAAAIQALPEEYRVVAALYFVDQFSYDEIATIAGCPVGTVRSRLHRGRRMLQKALWRMAEEQGLLPPTKEQ